MILEIPSKDKAYAPEKDTLLVKAAKILYGGEIGVSKLKEGL
jgi:hypothetical protein